MSLWSMTGFVTRSAELASGKSISVSIKSLNHKGFECSVKLPSELYAFEQKLRNELRAQLRRGKVDCSVLLSEQGVESSDKSSPEKFKKRVSEFHEACSKAGYEVELDSGTLYRLWREKDEASIVIDEVESVLLNLIKDSISVIKQERDREGAAISEELKKRSSKLIELRVQALPFASQVFENTKKLLSEKLNSLSGVANLADQLRMEIASLAKNSDVAEELARIEIHEKKVNELISCNAAEGVGREIDFVCQELLREWNTLSVKSQNASVSQIAVAAKLEVERIREQAANVG